MGLSSAAAVAVAVCALLVSTLHCLKLAWRQLKTVLISCCRCC